MISTHVTNRGPRPLIQSMIKSEGGYKGISGGVRYLSYLLNFFTNRIWLPQVAILASVVLTIINYPQLVLIERNDAEISETNMLVSLDREAKPLEASVNHANAFINESSWSPPIILGRPREWPALAGGAKLPSCHFEFYKVDPECPRVVPIWMDMKAGLGHKVLMWIMGLTTALAANAAPIALLESFDLSFDHGDYSGYKEFLNFDMHASKLEDIEAKYNLTQVGTRNLENDDTFDDFIDSTKGKCNLMIHVPVDVGIFDSRRNYPKFYERTRHILSCHFMHTNRGTLPELIYDRQYYNVAIHIRVGDISFHGDDKEIGRKYYTKIAEQLTVALNDFRVHYHVFAEDPFAGIGPVAQFDYLPEVFDAANSWKGGDYKISFHNAMDAKTTLYHMMNADMIVSGGSQFPVVAATLAMKAIFLAPGKPRSDKTGPFYSAYRPEAVDLDEDGTVSRPQTMSELQALIVMRYAEVHDLGVPYP